MAIRIKIKFDVLCDHCKEPLGHFDGFVTSGERKALEELAVVCKKCSAPKSKGIPIGNGMVLATGQSNTSEVNVWGTKFVFEKSQIGPETKCLFKINPDGSRRLAAIDDINSLRQILIKEIGERVREEVIGKPRVLGSEQVFYPEEVQNELIEDQQKALTKLMEEMK